MSSYRTSSLTLPAFLLMMALSIATPLAAFAQAPSRIKSCHDIQAELDRIDARMRLAYKGEVGEKLRAKRWQLSGQYFEQRCNTTSRRRP